MGVLGARPPVALAGSWGLWARRSRGQGESVAAPRRLRTGHARVCPEPIAGGSTQFHTGTRAGGRLSARCGDTCCRRRARHEGTPVADMRCKASKCVRQTHAQDDPKRQSACAENVRVRAPIRQDRQSACANPHGRGACRSGSTASPGGSRECERGYLAPARGPVMRIGAGTLMFLAQTL